jgi:anti-sigma regulatory factor (Ser/Thr protein kinase)
MKETPWATRPIPSPGPDAVTIGAWAPTALADVTAHRRQLADALDLGTGPPGADEDAAERLLLAFEELVSNGLRHGRAPVEATVTSFNGFWLLEVSDAAVDRPPTPAVGRDAAEGGLGLHLVTRLSGAHGWTTDGDRKNVWARIDNTPADTAGGRGEGSTPDQPGVTDRLVGVIAGLTEALGFAPTTRLLGPIGHLPRDLVTNLLAVVGEALTNVARHAQAHSAAVAVAVTTDAVTVRVTDDGIGLAAAPRDGGQADLGHRAAWHGGTLTVRPGRSRGTRLEWTAPYNPTPPRGGFQIPRARRPIDQAHIEAPTVISLDWDLGYESVLQNHSPGISGVDQLDPAELGLSPGLASRLAAWLHREEVMARRLIADEHDCVEDETESRRELLTLAYDVRREVGPDVEVLLRGRPLDGHRAP